MYYESVYYKGSSSHAYLSRYLEEGEELDELDAAVHSPRALPLDSEVPSLLNFEEQSADTINIEMPSAPIWWYIINAHYLHLIHDFKLSSALLILILLIAVSSQVVLTIIVTDFHASITILFWAIAVSYCTFWTCTHKPRFRMQTKQLVGLLKNYKHQVLNRSLEIDYDIGAEIAEIYEISAQMEIRKGCQRDLGGKRQVVTTYRELNQLISTIHQINSEINQRSRQNMVIWSKIRFYQLCYRYQQCCHRFAQLLSLSLKPRPNPFRSPQGSGVLSPAGNQGSINMYHMVLLHIILKQIELAASSPRENHTSLQNSLNFLKMQMHLRQKCVLLQFPSPIVQTFTQHSQQQFVEETPGQVVQIGEPDQSCREINESGKIFTYSHEQIHAKVDYLKEKLESLFVQRNDPKHQQQTQPQCHNYTSQTQGELIFEARIQGFGKLTVPKSQVSSYYVD